MNIFIKKPSNCVVILVTYHNNFHQPICNSFIFELNHLSRWNTLVYFHQRFYQCFASFFSKKLCFSPVSLWLMCHLQHVLSTSTPFFLVQHHSELIRAFERFPFCSIRKNYIAPMDAAIPQTHGNYITFEVVHCVTYPISRYDTSTR
jgi:hypothetical protein